MDKYIKLEDLNNFFDRMIKAFEPCPDKYDAAVFIQSAAVSIPTVAKATSQRSHWVWNPDAVDWGLGAWVCFNCGCCNDNLPHKRNIHPLNWSGSKYCPNCGAHTIEDPDYGEDSNKP